MATGRIPTVIDGHLVPVPGSSQTTPIAVGSSEWYEWLADSTHPSFSYHTPHGAVTIRREQKRNSWYWYAYHTVHGKLRKAYLGKSADLTPNSLAAASERLNQRVSVAAASNLRIHLLGSPSMERAGLALLVPSGKALALLAYLAGHDRPVSRQHILALLWPESTEEAAHKNLRNALWQLRRAVGAEAVHGSSYLSLGADVWVDSRVLEQTGYMLSKSDADEGNVGSVAKRQTAIDLYRGPFMDGFVVSGAPDFELWLATIREQLHEIHVRNLHALARSYRSAGDWDNVIAVSRAALTQDALQEPMYRLLMEAYAMQGDRATALRQYDLLRDMLDRELGVTPLPESDALRNDILQGALRFDSVSIVQRRAEQVAPGITAQPFVGRTNELAVLQNAWQITRTAQAQVVLLNGEAGIGKSRLWHVWSSALGDDATTLQARCLSTTQQLPFAPLVDILRKPATRERLKQMASGPSPPSWLDDLVRLAPELRDIRPGLPPALQLPPEEEQRHIFEALVHSLGLAPHRPVALFIDDLHWADRATLDWLGYVVHRAERLPLLVVGAFRTDEAPPALLRLQTTWGRDGILTALSLDRLSRSETATLVGALRGETQAADTLYDQSAGNPFFLLELLRAKPGVVPSSLTNLIEQRLEHLSSAARQVLHAAAVLQEEIVFGLLQQTSGRTDEETLDALDALLAAELLVENQHQFAFNHPLIAFVVDQALSGPRRSVLHRRAAAALERSYTDHSTIAGRLARHYREALDKERAAHFAERAGDAALAVAAPLEAAHFYEEALALEWTPARSYGWGRAMYRQGDLLAARPSIEAAIHGYERVGDRAMAARASLELALTFFADNQLAEVVRWAQRGRDYLSDAHDPRAQALAAYLLGAEMRIAHRSPETASAYLAESLRLTTELNEPGLLPSILLELGNARAQQGDLEGAIASYRELVVRAEQTGNDFNQALGYNNLAYHVLLGGDHVAARTAAEAGIALATERDLPLARTWLYSTSGEIALAEGDWDAATMALQRAVFEAERFGNAEHILGCRVNLALAEYGRGYHTAAREMLVAVEHDASGVPEAYLHFQIAYWLAMLGPENPATEPPADVLRRAAQELRAGEFIRMQRWLTCLQGLADLPRPVMPPIKPNA